MSKPKDGVRLLQRAAEAALAFTRLCDTAIRLRDEEGIHPGAILSALLANAAVVSQRYNCPSVDDFLKMAKGHYESTANVHASAGFKASMCDKCGGLTGWGEHVCIGVSP